MLTQVKERAKHFGLELRGRLFSCDNLWQPMTKLKVAEKENVHKVMKLEHKVNAQIESSKDVNKDSGGKSIV